MSTTAVRPAPWIGQSHVFDTPPESIDAALSEAGLNWDVVQKPVYFEDLDGNVVPFSYAAPTENVPTPPASAFVNVRSDNGRPLGIVSERYALLQNRPAFDWADPVVRDGSFQVVAGGPLNGGKQVWLMLAMPEPMDVGGDETTVYLYVINSHDGFRAVRGAVSPIRAACENQLPFIVPGADRSFSIAHLGDPAYRMHEARRALDITTTYAEQFKVIGDQLAQQKISEKQLRGIMDKLWPSKEDTSDRKRQNLTDKKNHIVWLWKEGPTVGNAPGTAWSAANAICEFIDYGDSVEHDGKLTRAMNDPTGDKKRVLSLVRQAVKV